jgi:hypothetical protein
MAEWRHPPAFDEPDIVAPLRPPREQFPGKFRSPPEPTDDGLQQSLDHTPQARLCSNPTDEYHLAAGPEHTRTLVERRLRVRNSRYHVIRHDDVESGIRK